MSQTVDCEVDRSGLAAGRPAAGHEVSIDDVRTVVTRIGPLTVRMVGTGAGPIAVLWHSLFVDSRSWGRVEADLATQRCLVIITGPGHGASGDTGRRYTLDDCAEAAGTILDELGIEAPVDWVGNAWGGAVGIMFAIRWPERCRTLVTLGTPIQALSRTERARTNTLLVAYRMVGAVGFIRKAVADTLLSPRTRAQDPSATDLVEDCLIHADPGPLRNAIVSISLQRTDLTTRLPEVSVPTLFVTGSEHKGWTPEQAVSASKLIARGSAAIVDGSSYLVPLEEPAATVRLVHRFWLDN